MAVTCRSSCHSPPSSSARISRLIAFQISHQLRFETISAHLSLAYFECYSLFFILFSSFRFLGAPRNGERILDDVEMMNNFEDDRRVTRIELENSGQIERASRSAGGKRMKKGAAVEGANVRGAPLPPHLRGSPRYREPRGSRAGPVRSKAPSGDFWSQRGPLDRSRSNFRANAEDNYNLKEKIEGSRIRGATMRSTMTGRVVCVLVGQFCVLLAICWAESVITAHNNFGLAPIDPEIANEVDWRLHACRRECKEDDPPMECYYTFKLESYRTMSKACYECPYNLTDCFRPHCIPADGVKRSLLVVNRQMPGPPIEVCQGDRIIVDVINLLHSESTTMHWHGQHHVKTPYMDGVPYISQCPIPPGATFRYDYEATEAGTHFWHSHLGFQRGDGVFGPMIVRVPPSKDWHKDLYDADEHTLLILDWAHQLGLDMFLDHHHAAGSNKAPNLLVNGYGRYKNSKDDNGTTTAMPLATFNVKQNLRYRFRLINAEFLNCPIEVSIDNHTLVVVSSDGRDVEPIEAESLVSYAGERFDFIVEMNQNVDNYWIRFRGLMDCDERFLSAHQAAVLRYEGAPNEMPNGTVTYERVLSNSSMQINALNEGTETNSSTSVVLLNAMDKDDESTARNPDYQFYVSYDFYKKDNPHFHRKNLYGFYQVKNTTRRVLTPQLNHISMKLPPVPLLSQRDMVDTNKFCNSSTIKDCEDDYCACTHVLQVKTGSVVELVLVDEGVAYDANHPFHLHGYQFRVVAMKKVGKNTTRDEVRKLDAEGLISRKLERAPLKDTVTVPDGGYTIIRFHANNPGYWLFHCHIEFHAEVGMALIFKVGEHEEMLPVPHNFPTCGNWRPTNIWDILNRKDDRTNITQRMPDDDRHEGDQKENEIGITSNPYEEALLKFLPKILKDLGMASGTSKNSAQFFTMISCIVMLLARAWL